MPTLNEFATDEEIQNYLLYHMDSADSRKSKINPSLTKQQVWDIHMGVIMQNGGTRVRSILTKNLKKEFGDYYES